MRRTSNRLQLLRFFALGATATACGALQTEAPRPEDPDTATPTDAEPEAPDVPELHARGGSPPLVLEQGVNEGGYVGDRVTWRDAAGRSRVVFLVKNDAVDPSGSYGGYARRMTYMPTSTTTRTIGPGQTEPGFGFLYATRSSDYATVSNKAVAGTRVVTSVGPAHAVIEHRYPQLKTDGGVVVPVKATVQWVFVAGRSAPLWSVTYDASAAGPNAIELDTKAPYGDVEYTGSAAATVDGVCWGDRRKFVTTSAGPVTLQSAWSYAATNVVPHVCSWSTTNNAEMGLVQTERYTRHDGGYGWFYSNWGKTSATRVIDAGSPAGQLMPADWNWTYYLHQYSLPGGTSVKSLGWGMNPGAVGKTSFPTYGDAGTASGYPYQSYSVFVVTGAKNATSTQVAQLERLTASSLTATRGAVVTSAPAGVGRTDARTLSPAGYNAVYATWDVRAEAGTGAAVFTLDPKAKSIQNPVFRVVDYPLATLPSGVRLGATPLVPGTDYDASLDGGTLWLVLKRTISAATTLGMNEAAAPPTWATVAVDAGQSVGGFTSDVVRWRDAGNKERSAALVRNDAADPAGFYGGYVRRFTYTKADGSVRAATGGRTPDHPGWGYTVHHDGDDDLDRNTSSSRRAPGTWARVLAGRHHVIHQFSWNVLRTQGELPAHPPVDRPIKVTIQYLFATGKDHPILAHTVDASALAANAVNLDDRGPAGELAFDGVDGTVSGAGWGDRYQFKTTSAPLSLASTWDYTATNRVPYVHMWSDPENAEMGAVQTDTWQRKDAGFGWFYDNWGRTSATKVVGPGAPATQSMPAEWNWTYQLSQWELPAPSKRIAWGTNSGAVGKAAYPAYGDDRTLSGYPYHTRTVAMVLGPKGAVAGQRTEIERTVDAQLTVLEGAAVTSGPAGVGGASAATQTYQPAGYNPTYGVFELVAATTKARFVLDTRGAALKSPTFRVRSYTGPEPSTLELRVDGGAAQTLTKDVDFFPSLVTFGGQSELWITLQRSLSGQVEIAVNTALGGGGTGLSPSYQHFDVNHVLSTGQSNSVANSGTPVLTTTQPYANLSFDVGVMTGATCDGQGCKAYQTPASFVPLVEGDRFFNYGVETMSSGLANEVTKIARSVYLVGQAPPRTSHDLLVSLHGRSGRTYWCLRKGGCSWEGAAYIPGFTDGMRQVDDAKRIAAAQGKSYVVRAVTAIHGESDHYASEFPLDGTNGAPNAITNYSDALLEWQRDYDAEVKARTGQTLDVPLFVSQLSDWTDTRSSAVANLQLDAHVRAPGKVVLVGPTYHLPFATDCIHFTNHGNRRLGEYFAKAYLKHVLEGKAWEPVRPLQITRAGSVITVKFHVPAPPLVLDTTNVTNPGSFGFRYTDASGAPPAIQSVAVTAPDTVTITLASAPTGASRRLSYAQNAPVPNACPGPTVGARGNVRDSDATPSQYGYPLHNWAVHFDAAVP